MKTSTKKTGLAIKTSIKAGGLCTSNHSRAAKTGLAIKTSIKAGGLCTSNHNRTAAAVR
jgi:hypothetical protein